MAGNGQAFKVVCRVDEHQKLQVGVKGMSILDFAGSKPVRSHFSGKSERVHPLGNFSNRYYRSELPGSGINGRDGRRCRVGDINDRAVGSERDPLGHGAGGGVIGRVDIGHRAVPIQLEVGQRIFKDCVGYRAPDPQ